MVNALPPPVSIASYPRERPPDRRVLPRVSTSERRPADYTPRCFVVSPRKMYRGSGVHLLRARLELLTSFRDKKQKLLLYLWRHLALRISRAV